MDHQTGGVSMPLRKIGQELSKSLSSIWVMGLRQEFLASHDSLFGLRMSLVPWGLYHNG